MAIGDVREGKEGSVATDVSTLQPMQYLDKALTTLRDLGLLPEKRGEAAPITALLNRISDLDEQRVTLIARTLDQMSLFNEVVREQITAMDVGERYNKIAEAFNSIRDDAKQMVDQIEDGRIDTFERLSNIWQKVDARRHRQPLRQDQGHLPRRRQGDQGPVRARAAHPRRLPRLPRRAEAVRSDGAGGAEEGGRAKLAEARARMDEASKAVEAATTGRAGRARQAGARPRREAARRCRTRRQRYQIAKDLSDNLTVGYNTSEVIMARLMQTTSAKERVYQQSVSFFSTNESVLTALSASFTGMHGLHESTQTLNTMKEGIYQSLETLSEIGGKIQEEALKAGYGPTIRAESVKKLVDSVVNYQERSREIIEEMRKLSTQNAARHPRGGRGRQAADGAADPAGHGARRQRELSGVATAARHGAGGRRADRPRRRRHRSTTSCWRWTWWTALRHADTLVERELSSEEARPATEGAAAQALCRPGHRGAGAHPRRGRGGAARGSLRLQPAACRPCRVRWRWSG